MKTEKGITVVSLAIYVVAMLITVTIITVLTSYFYKNIDITGEDTSFLSEFTRFESYFLTETSRQGNTVNEIFPLNEEMQHEYSQPCIIFSSGNQYTFVRANKAVYQNNVKIASNVEECTFSQNNADGKTVVTVKLTIKDKTRNMKFTLKN